MLMFALRNELNLLEFKNVRLGVCVRSVCELTCSYIIIIKNLLTYFLRAQLILKAIVRDIKTFLTVYFAENCFKQVSS